MRSFVAISLNHEATVALAPLQRALPAGRPVPPENLHLTLAFLDDQPEQVLEALHDELLALSSAPFHITFLGIECFGRALAIGVKDSAPLVALHRKIQIATRRAGIVLPRRRFRPHVTIARLKHERRQAAHIPHDWTVNTLPEMLVTGFTLYESTLRPEGARHVALAHFTF
ncbi:RNA 2',3'-cyclic phosphodiesterase [Ruegeria arenilitoris]|uniref:RNA 2',3'-cyclic phosphodiesterase n=1 Tax=Ruegeria arenilitoris TaxID=1173585 RepID=UPI0020C57DC2|nr:RNA 2',3'-cyclic phosphodiesterase [Ruegeria arenilitoris]